MNRKLGLIAIAGLVVVLAACTTTRLSTMDRGVVDFREGRYQAAFQSFDDAVR